MQAKVLIAESDPVSSEMLTGIVQMANAIPLTTSSLKACREMAVRERPQVAICADELPDGSGIDLVQFLRQLDEGIETVLLSRNTAVRVVENAIDEGIADFLAKPFLPKDFRDCLTRLLRRSEARVRVTDESSPKNVLLVANDQLAIGRIQKLVSQVGMTTHLAGDMPAAQRQLALPGIDILLLDQELESDAEVTMLEDLAYRYRAVRIVVMTTSRNPETLLSVLRRTDVNLLLKPFNRVRFYREVLSSRQSRSDNLWAPQGAEAAAPQPEPEPEPEPPPPVPPPHSPDLEELSPAVQAWLVSAPEPQVVREAQHIHEHQAEHVRDDFTERIRELERELQERDRELAQRDVELSERRHELADRDRVISERDRSLAAARVELDHLRAQPPPAPVSVTTAAPEAVADSRSPVEFNAQLQELLDIDLAPWTRSLKALQPALDSMQTEWLSAQTHVTDIERELKQQLEMLQLSAATGEMFITQLEGALTEVRAKEQFLDEHVKNAQAQDESLAAVRREHEALLEAKKELEEKVRQSELQHQGDLERLEKTAAELREQRDAALHSVEALETARTDLGTEADRVAGELQDLKREHEATNAALMEVRELLAQEGAVSDALRQERDAGRASLAKLSSEHGQLEATSAQAHEAHATLSKEIQLVKQQTAGMELVLKRSEEKERAAWAENHRLKEQVNQLEAKVARQSTQLEPYVRTLEPLVSFGLVSMELLSQVGSLLAGVLRLLPKVTQGSREAQREMNDALKEAAGLLLILGRLSRPRSAAPTNVHAVLEETRRLVDRRMKSLSRSVELDLKATAPTVTADPGELELVMVNLVWIAAETGHRGAPLTIASRAEPKAFSVIIDTPAKSGVAPALDVAQFEPRGGLIGLVPVLAQRLLTKAGGTLHAQRTDDRLSFVLRWPLP